MPEMDPHLHPAGSALDRFPGTLVPQSLTDSLHTIQGPREERRGRAKHFLEEHEPLVRAGRQSRFRMGYHIHTLHSSDSDHGGRHKYRPQTPQTGENRDLLDGGSGSCWGSVVRDKSLPDHGQMAHTYASSQQQPRDWTHEEPWAQIWSIFLRCHCFILQYGLVMFSGFDSPTPNKHRLIEV